jgi:hypothetical protein
VGLLAVVGLAGVLLVLAEADPITEENYSKISKGMPKNDVDAMLGAPTFECQPIAMWPGSEGEYRGWTWIGQRHSIGVHFDETGHVWQKEFCKDFQPSIVDRLHRWLGW